MRTASSLAPGFIDVHTHDDTAVIRTPAMLPKLSQGVTTVIVGNCGISASPVTLRGEPPDPMNLLGDAEDFRYPTFAAYVDAIREAQPAVNVAALIGHTALRNNHMDRLDRTATESEIEAMRAQLEEALDGGALGLSSGLAYLSANSATTEEVLALAQPLAAAGAVYTTHMRTETEKILDAMERGLRDRPHEPRARHRLASQVRGHCQLGTQRRGLAGPRSRTADAARRLRLLSVRGRLQHTGPAPGG